MYSRHPGPLVAVAVAARNTNLGVTLAIGVLIAIPTIARQTRRPSIGTTLFTVLLPVVLMMGKALVDIFAAEGNAVRLVLDLLGTPPVALLLAVFVAMVTFGRDSGMNHAQIAVLIHLATGSGSPFFSRVDDAGFWWSMSTSAALSRRRDPLLVAHGDRQLRSPDWCWFLLLGIAIRGPRRGATAPLQ